MGNNFKRFVLFFLSLFFLCQNFYARFEVKGNDLIICYGFCAAGNHLGLDMEITGGIPPFEFCWETQIQDIYDPDKVFYASEILSDTTEQTPFLGSLFGSEYGWVPFYLTVKDSEGNIAQTTIKVRYSDLEEIWYLSEKFYINKGDSILLDASEMDFGGILPYNSCSWNPVAGLSDPNSPKTWCKPDETTSYSLCITDSIGCTAYVFDLFRVIVDKTNIDDFSENKIYQQNGIIYFTNPKREEILLSFFDTSGRLLFSTRVNSNSYAPNSNEIKGSIILCKINIGGKEHLLKYLP